MLIIDGAGWHRSKNLQIPDNISIIFLPPYSPELNPVDCGCISERTFWQTGYINVFWSCKKSSVVYNTLPNETVAPNI